MASRPFFSIHCERSIAAAVRSKVKHPIIISISRITTIFVIDFVLNDNKATTDAKNDNRGDIRRGSPKQQKRTFQGHSQSPTRALMRRDGCRERSLATITTRITTATTTISIITTIILRLSAVAVRCLEPSSRSTAKTPKATSAAVLEAMQRSAEAAIAQCRALGAYDWRILAISD